MLVLMMRGGLVIAVAVVTMAGDVPSGWSVCDIGTLGPTADFTVPTGMNNHGVVIGDSLVYDNGDITLAFVWSHGRMHAVPEPEGARYVHVRAINDTGQIAGDARFEGWYNYAYRWTDDVPEYIGVLGTGFVAIAWGINAAGYVVGWSEIEDTAQPPAHAFLWNGELLDLGTATGNSSDSSAAHDINDAGIVVGSSEFPDVPRPRYTGSMLENGVFQELPTLEGDLATQADKINTSGVVVGTSSYSGEAHAVMWREEEIINITPFIPDNPNNVEESEPFDVTDYDEVVGIAVFENGTADSFLWREGQITWFNLLEPPGFEWDLIPHVINNAGQMACRGFYRADPSGVPQRTFILTPAECRGFPRGDANCDGVVNNFDIDTFVLALTNVDRYAACNWLCNLDINRDGVVNNFDIDPFVALLSGG